MNATDPHPVADMSTQARHAYRAALLLAGVVATVLCLFYLAPPSGAWQLFVLVGADSALGVIAIASARLCRGGRSNLGAGVLIGSTLVAIVVNSALLGDLGVALGLAAPLATAAMALYLPQKWINRTMLAGVAAGALAGLLDLLELPGGVQTVVPAIQTFAPASIVVTVLIYVFLVARQFRSYSLPSKLIVAFLAVAIVPVGVLGFLNERAIREVLSSTANQALLAAAKQTAASIDAFIGANLDAIRAESQLPEWSEYLSLPIDQRSGSEIEKNVQGILRSLSGKSQHISSYSLIDRHGTNVADTRALDIGKDESDRDYFQAPLAFGQAVVSPVEFSPTTGEASLTFSSPLRDEAGKVIGVLRVRYRGEVLQGLVAENTGIAGEQSFGVLFDEKHIRLAHGAAPGYLFRPANHPTLEQGLAHALSQPYFVADEVDAGGQRNQAAVARLDAQPWLVAFFQPQAVSLAPVQEQTRNTVLAGLVIAGVMAGAAVGMGHVLAAPIARLTGVAQRVAAGDLTAQATVESADEVGLLATTFNTMTAQLRDLISSLEARVEARTGQLRAGADVGRAVASILEPDQLLREVVNLITDRFGFYYTAVFMLDETGTFAVLREASGEAGRIFKERGHKLEVGGQSMVGVAVAQRKPQIAPAQRVGQEAVRFANPLNSPDPLFSVPLLPDTRSQIALPLMVGDRVLGALDVQSTQAAAFDETGAAALQSMADQIAIALNNAEQFQRAEAQAKTQTDLLTAYLELTGQLDRAVLSDLIIRRAMQLLHADGAGIWLPVGDDEIELVEMISVGQSQVAGQRLAKGLGLFGTVFATGRALRVDDYAAWRAQFARSHAASIRDPRSNIQAAPFHAAIAVPMIWQGGTSGVLAVTHSQPGRTFSADDERIAQLFAAQAAAALVGATLLEQQRRTLEELDAINRQLTAEAWTREFDRLPGDAWRARFARSSAAPVEEAFLPEVELAVASMKPVAWSQRADQSVASPFQAAMAAPIVLRGEVIGALQVGEIGRPRPWSAEDLEFIQAVADQVAQAVENARLIEETRRAARRERALSESADKIRRNTDVERILHTAAEELARHLHAARVMVRLHSDGDAGKNSHTKNNVA